MNEITIAVKYDNDNPTVSGRELHAALMVDTRYNDWFKRMCEYGFIEEKDFYSFLSKTSEGGRPSTDHQLTIDTKVYGMIGTGEIRRIEHSGRHIRVLKADVIEFLIAHKNDG